MARKARRPSAARKRATRTSTAKPRQKARRRTAAKPAKRVAKRPARRPARPKQAARKKTARSAARTARPAPKARARSTTRQVEPVVPVKTPHLDRPRRVLDDTVPSVPSSLNLDRHPSAARSGHEDMRHRAGRNALASGITAGDSDVSPEDAYFTGDEAPGGDNPSPDQDVVEEIGKALGVEYNDAEELRGSDKIADRDKHRWELDPASSEDYKSRK